MRGLPDMAALRTRAKPHLLSLLLILTAVSATAGVAGFAFPRISVLDEATHIDYSYRMSVGGIPRKGERLSQEALSIWACRGFFDENTPFAECAPPGDFKAGGFPGRGYNYNQFHPPLYYAATGLTARALVAVTPIDSFVTAARLTGILWIGAGLFLAYVVMLQLGVSMFTSRTMAVTGAFIPAIWQTGAIVTNDNATIVAGAAVGLASVWAVRDRCGPLLVFGVAMFAMWTKSANGLALICGMLFVGYDAFDRFRTKRPYLRQAASAAVMAVSVPAINYGWRAIQRVRVFDPDYVNPIKGASGEKTTGVPFAQLWSEIFRLLKPTFAVPSYLGLATRNVSLWTRLFEGLLAVAPLATAMIFVSEPVRRRLGLSAVTAAMAGALMVVTQYWLSNEAYLGRANPRYGLSLLAFNIVCAAFLVDSTPRSRLVGLVFGCSGALVTVPLLIGAL